MGRFMFGIVVEIFFETGCFFIGEIVIYVVSFGRWKTSLQKGNQTPRRQIVTALIGLIVIVCTIAVIVWLLCSASVEVVEPASQQRGQVIPNESAQVAPCRAHQTKDSRPPRAAILLDKHDLCAILSAGGGPRGF